MRASLLPAALLSLSLWGQPEIRVRVLSPERSASPAAQSTFSALGATWYGDPDAAIGVRSSAAGRDWSPWRLIRADSDIHPGPAGRIAGTLLYMGEGQHFAEFRVVSGTPAGLQLFLIDPGSSDAKTTLSPRAAAAGEIVTRQQWSCPIPDGPASKSYAPVTHLIVHHTADSPPPGGDFAAWVRAIWAFHVNVNGWADIGYNYLIAPDGTVFEGRAGGPGVIGAHFSCVNTGTAGIALLGLYSSQQPSQPAWLALTSLLARTARAAAIHPLLSTPHAASQLNLAVISGHRDSRGSPRACGATECPGNALYPLLSALRSDTAFDWTPSGLWHRTAGAQWRYADPVTGTYDTGAEPNSGTLESASFLAPAGAALTFQSWFETENSATVYDEKYVEASLDGGPWFPLLQISGEPRLWTSQRVSLPPGGPIRLRFRFDTIDAALNRLPGWHIAAIELTGN